MIHLYINFFRLESEKVSPKWLLQYLQSYTTRSEELVAEELNYTFNNLLKSERGTHFIPIQKEKTSLRVSFVYDKENTIKQ